ncbi:MAG: RNA polymerase sigma factor [Proteobacteria bacterium]|nr:RNA polymerase sigma factor [Pseudomonadota bacterium]
MNSEQALPIPLPGDDRALARRVADGEHGAFELLMRRYNRRLYRLARAVLRDEAEAKDALQEAYLCAYRSMDRYRGEAALSTWLSRLVLNECYARARRSARRENIIPMSTMDAAMDEHTGAGLDEAPERMVAREQMREVLEHTVSELPEAFRVVFVLRSVEELAVQEIADLLHIPAETVRSRHFRARGLLREALAREIDLAEGDLYPFGGPHCDALVAAVLVRLDAGG